ncbi:OmpP1/FadL family transporter [Saccharicrinis aurantiacus]|uniref:OmpP1/FadL family transporter n=1 Tax=Saccharicrinis aurantiacus TaxID=1849719 RepID=UPI00249207B4|nr:outer membrane protein transport protein [Saccharicrinis aurantiacus]
MIKSLKRFISKTLMMRYLSLIVVSSVMLTSKAEGYQVNLQGQKNTAMGHTGTGLVNGASAIHFNPGALSMMENSYDFSAGASFVMSTVNFNKAGSNYSAQTNSPVGTPLYFYGAAKLNESWAVGLSVTTPYGNGLSWEKDWDGRYLIQDITLRSFFIQPTVSYQINEKLGIGAGAMIVAGSVDLNKALPITGANGEASTNLNGTATAFGYNLGIFYQASEKFSLGLNYRSEVTMTMESGDATFSNIPNSLMGQFANTTFDSELPLPANLTLGLGYQLGDKLTLAADFQYVFWSTYEELVFEFASETIPTSINPREYKNTMIYRVGAEYALSDKFDIMAGAYYDQTPIEDHLLNPETPGANKIGLSCGFTFRANEKLSIDASMLYIKGLEREGGYEPANFYGTYNSQAFIPGIGVNYAF